MTRVAALLTCAVMWAAVASAATPAPASASVSGTLCTLSGLVSGLVGKACTLATNAGRLVGAGQKALGGHLGAAVGELTGSGVSRTVVRAAGLAAIVATVAGGGRYVLRATAQVIGATTRPDLGSTWFSASYWRMAAVSALLTLPFLFAAAVQAMMRSDLALLLRAAFGYLPLGLLGVAIATPVTTLLLAGSDELSTIVTSASGGDGLAFLNRTSALVGVVTGLSGTLFVAFFVGLLTTAAALVLWVELLIRDAAVYVIVLMLPLFFAAMVWPARRIWAIRAVEVLVALILSKFVIVAVLALGGAALGHTLIPGAAASLAGATLVLLAAFSPWALLRLLPLHELAGAAAGGLRAGPGQHLMAAEQRAWPAADASEQAAGELPARMRAWVQASTADVFDDAGAAAPGGVAPEGWDVGDGPGDAAAHAAGGAPDGGAPTAGGEAPTAGGEAPTAGGSDGPREGSVWPANESARLEDESAWDDTPAWDDGSAWPGADPASERRRTQSGLPAPFDAESESWRELGLHSGEYTGEQPPLAPERGGGDPSDAGGAEDDQ